MSTSSVPSSSVPSSAGASSNAVPSINPEARTLAAIDLGSNSFHMVLGRVVGGKAVITDRLKEMVQLGAGLDKDRMLSDASQQRALACIERFAQRASTLPGENVRAVGTNTLRVARNGERFLERAKQALGHPIEIISGVEEARLIYSGVMRDRPAKDERLLVVDIGGGSTELIIGQGETPLDLESLYMGSIAMMQRHFDDGRINAKRFRRAEITAMQELERVQGRFRRLGWNTAVGASGTVRAVARVVRENGWSAEGITRSSLGKLRDAVVEAGSVERLSFKGLSQARASVLPGGLAVLLAIFETLDVDVMQVSKSALREGLLNDLLGRVLCDDVRSTTVNLLMERYRVDQQQAHRVEEMVLRLLSQVTAAWGLPPLRAQELCSWAARLHEIGLDVAHSHYHKHGAYLIANGDMPGFSRQEQRLLAALVRAHRRKFPSGLWKELPDHDRFVEQLAVLLRLAVVLHRSRTDVGEVTVLGGRRTLEVRLTPGWQEKHALTAADLIEEAELLRAGGFELKVPGIIAER